MIDVETLQKQCDELIRANSNLIAELSTSERRRKLIKQCYVDETGTILKLKEQVAAYDARIIQLRTCLAELGDRMPRCECVNAHEWALDYLKKDDELAAKP